MIGSYLSGLSSYSLGCIVLWFCGSIPLSINAPARMPAFLPMRHAVLGAAALPAQVWRGGCGGELLGEHRGHAGAVCALALERSTPSVLLSGGDDGSVRVWNVLPPTCAPLSGMSKVPGTVPAVDADAVVSVPATAAVRVMSGHTSGVSCLALSCSHSRIVLSAGRDGALIAWDYCTGGMLHRWGLPGGVLLCLSVDVVERRACLLFPFDSSDQ